MCVCVSMHMCMYIPLIYTCLDNIIFNVNNDHTFVGNSSYYNISMIMVSIVGEFNFEIELFSVLCTILINHNEMVQNKFHSIQVHSHYQFKLQNVHILIDSKNAKLKCRYSKVIYQIILLFS